MKNIIIIAKPVYQFSKTESHEIRPFLEMKRSYAFFKEKITNNDIATFIDSDNDRKSAFINELIKPHQDHYGVSIITKKEQYIKGDIATKYIYKKHLHGYFNQIRTEIMNLFNFEIKKYIVRDNDQEIIGTVYIVPNLQARKHHNSDKYWFGEYESKDFVEMLDAITADLGLGNDTENILYAHGTDAVGVITQREYQSRDGSLSLFSRIFLYATNSGLYWDHLISNEFKQTLNEPSPLKKRIIGN